MFFSLDHLIHEMKSTRKQFTFMAFLFALHTIVGIFGVVNCAPMRDGSKVVYLGLFQNENVTEFHMFKFGSAGEASSDKESASTLNNTENAPVSYDHHQHGFFSAAPLQWEWAVEAPFVFKTNEPNNDIQETAVAYSTLGEEYLKCFADDGMIVEENGRSSWKNITLNIVDEFSNFFSDYSACINRSNSENIPHIPRRRHRRAPPSIREFFAETMACMRMAVLIRDTELSTDLNSSSQTEDFDKLIEKYQCLTVNLQAFYYKDLTPLFLSRVSGSLQAVSQCTRTFKNSLLQNSVISVDEAEFVKQVWICQYDYWVGLVSDPETIDKLTKWQREIDENLPTEDEQNEASQLDSEFMGNHEYQEGDYVEFRTCRLTKNDAEYLLFLFSAVTFLMVLFFAGVIYERAMRMKVARKRELENAMRARMVIAAASKVTKEGNNKCSFKYERM